MDRDRSEPRPQGERFEPLETTTNPPEVGERPFEEPRKKKSTVKILLLFVALFFLGLLLLGGAILGLGWLYVSSAKELPAKPEDRDLIVDGPRLSSWMEGFSPSDDHERLYRLRYVDGVIEVCYEYSDEMDPNAPWTQSVVTFEKNASDARMTYGGLWIGCQAGLAAEGDSAVERNELFRWGDDSHFAVLEDPDSGAYGNLFVARKGRVIYEFWVSNVYFDDAESVEELLRPLVRKAATYRP